MADAAGGAPAAAPAPGSQQPAAAQPQGKETPAQAAARIRADLGEGEREYDQKHVLELAQRGRKAAQTLSLAEKRAQEVAARERALEERDKAFKSGDLKAMRKALRAMGIDERALANDVGQDMLDDLELSKDPVRWELREAQRKLQEVEESKKTETQKQQEVQQKAEVERHTNDLSELFTDVMARTGLPRESAAAVFPRLASLYSAVESTGGKVDPDLAAQRIKATIQAEHRALYLDPKTGNVNEAAARELFGEEGMMGLMRMSARWWKAKTAGGGQPQQGLPQQVSQPQQQAKGERWSWRDLEKKSR